MEESQGVGQAVGDGVCVRVRRGEEEWDTVTLGEWEEEGVVEALGDPVTEKVCSGLWDWEAEAEGLRDTVMV